MQSRLFAQHSVAPRFVHEFVDGVSRVNYGQDGSIHAFVNLISLTGAGVAGGSLFSVGGGNGQVCEGLLAQTGSDVRTNTRVVAIAAAPETQPRLRYRITTDQGADEGFDAVILATPLERTSIQFSGVTGWSPTPVERQYQVTHATCVAGKLNPTYFSLPQTARLPQTILTSEDPRVPFSSIGAIGYSPTWSVPIHKVFSRTPLDDTLIERLFTQPKDVMRIVWHAYPVLKPSPHWEPFRLQNGLYYVNAMESAVSTMETEAVASRNVVQLLVNDVDAKSRFLQEVEAALHEQEAA